MLDIFLQVSTFSPLVMWILLWYFPPGDTPHLYNSLCKGYLEKTQLISNILSHWNSRQTEGKALLVQSPSAEMTFHHPKHFTPWFHLQDHTAPINRSIHMLNLDWSTTGNEPHTDRLPQPNSTVAPHKYGLQCFDCIETIKYEMHINWEVCKITWGQWIIGAVGCIYLV